MSRTRTNIELDDELVETAMRLYGTRTKRETVNLAVRRLVGAKLSKAEALALEGSGWEGDLDASPGARATPELSGAPTHSLNPAGRGMTFCDTVSSMGDMISVRLDEDARRALAELEATGISRSEAVRLGLVTAAQRLRDRRRLAAEAQALADDADDRAEAAAVAQLMEDLRAPW